MEAPSPRYWQVTEIWHGETIYIVGGGPSLKRFNWDRLDGKRVIGCNDAYKLGPLLVDLCFFGDDCWYEVHSEILEFECFAGMKASCSDALEVINDAEVLLLQRDARVFNLEHPWRVGWFGDTGSAAVNLAVKMGASRIVLLGFDMRLGKKGEAEPNWYRNYLHPVQQQKIYNKFLKGWRMMAKQLREKRPDVEVINANPKSRLNLFPKCKLGDVL